MELKVFCQQLPKIELHAHLNGSISLEQLKKYNNNYECNFDEYLSPSTPLKKCFEIFDMVHNIINEPESLYKATCSVIKDFYDDNVIYLELRSTPRHVKSLMTKDEYIEAIIKAIRICSKRIPNIIVKLLISVNRAHGFENAQENIVLAMKYYKKYPDYIVGLDLSGDPTEGQAFLTLLKTARDGGLKISAHCAEVPNVTEIEDILKFKPDRMGHCTHIHPNLQGSQKLFDMLVESKIPVEICLTSNIKCATVSNYSEHQFNYLYEAEHPICIATDDKSVFHTTLSEEYQILGSELKLSTKELFNLSLAAVDYSFATDMEKEKLRNKINNFYSVNLDSIV